MPPAAVDSWNTPGVASPSARLAVKRSGLPVRLTGDAPSVMVHVDFAIVAANHLQVWLY
jgi:hypothetical protein